MKAFVDWMQSFVVIDWVVSSCHGRMGRKNFILLSLILIMVEKALEFFVFVPLGVFGIIGTTIATALSICFFFAVVHVAIRRLHDMGLPWWFCFGFLFPTVLWVLMLVGLMFFPGVPSDKANEYGTPESEGRTLRDVFFYGHR